MLLKCQFSTQHIIFWDDIFNLTVEHILGIIDVTTETADVLATIVFSKLEEQHLSLKKMVAVGRDGPNVNISLMNKVKEEASKVSGGGVIDYGSCVDHVAHNAFKAGLKQSPVDVGNLAVCLHGFFKHSVIRREEFAYDLIEIDEDHATFLRHVGSRWLSLEPCLERIDKNFPAIEKYFLRTLPTNANNGDKNAQEAMKTKYYELITGYLNKSECRFMIKMVVYVCKQFTPFLTKMQTSSPMITRLYNECSKLLFKVLTCFIKPTALPDKHDGKKLAQLDVKKENFALPKMSPSAETCFKALTKNVQNMVIKNIFMMLQKSAIHLQKKMSPLQSNLLKYLRALEPEFYENATDFGKGDIVKAGKEFKCFSSADIDALALQWERFVELKFKRVETQRIDAFYGKHLKQLCSDSEGEDFSTLARFIKTVLCMPSSNASVERG